MSRGGEGGSEFGKQEQPFGRTCEGASEYGDTFSDEDGHPKNEEVFHDAQELRGSTECIYYCSEDSHIQLDGGGLHLKDGESSKEGENNKDKKHVLAAYAARRLRKPSLLHKDPFFKVENLQKNTETELQKPSITKQEKNNDDKNNITVEAIQKDKTNTKLLRKSNIPLSRDKFIKKIEMDNETNKRSGSKQKDNISELTTHDETHSKEGLENRKRNFTAISSMVNKRQKQSGTALDEVNKSSTNIVNKPPLWTSNERASSAKTRLEEIKNIRKRIAEAKNLFSRRSPLDKSDKLDQKLNPYVSLVPSTKEPIRKLLPNLNTEMAQIKSQTPVQGKLDESKDCCLVQNEINKEIENFTVTKVELRPLSAKPVIVEKIAAFSSSSLSSTGSNTDPNEDQKLLIELRNMNEKFELSEICLKHDNETLKDLLNKQQKKETEHKKELTNLSETLMKTNSTLKDLEKKILEKDTTIAQLRGNIAKMQNMTEKIKEKDNQLGNLENQLTNIKEEYNKIKFDLEKINDENQNNNKEKEKLKGLVNHLTENKDCLEIKLKELSDELLKKEENEKEIFQELEVSWKEIEGLKRTILRRENELSEVKTDLERQESSSISVVALSEQLIEKDTIIKDLEQLRDNSRMVCKEVCGMLSTVFKEFGKPMSESEIETLISSGKVLTVKNTLIGLLESSGRSSLDISHEECKKVIFNLEDRAAILEAELEESKNFTDTLAGVISTGKIIDVEGVGESESDKQLRRADNNRFADRNMGDTPSLAYAMAARPDPTNNIPQAHYELFVLLEGKRQALMKMERKVQELEEIHSKCSQKRVRNEMRIDQLEMALATVKMNK